MKNWILVVVVALAGCGPKKTPEEIVLDKAVGTFDMQYNEAQLGYIRTLTETDQKPFATIKIEKDRSFEVMVVMREATGKVKGGLAGGKITAKGSDLKMNATLLNKKPNPKPTVLNYTLSDSGDALVHKDGTTFLRRTDPKKRAGNADLAKLAADDAKKRAEDKIKAAQEPPKKGTPPPPPPSNK